MFGVKPNQPISTRIKSQIILTNLDYLTVLLVLIFNKMNKSVPRQTKELRVKTWLTKRNRLLLLIHIEGINFLKTGQKWYGSN